MGFESRNSAIFQMICDLDADGNGTIDFAEWVLLMTKRGNDKFNRANLEKMYSLFDDDHKEDITKENLRRVAQ